MHAGRETGETGGKDRGAADTAVAPPAGGSRDAAPPPSSGAHALALIAQQSRRLRRLRPRVLADSDPEALHQWRVSLRRLRTTLQQFGPALEPPPERSRRRIARVARRSGDCRDLDVLRAHLERDLLPQLPTPERQVLLGRLQRQRARAFTLLAATLESPRCRRLLRDLKRWPQQARLTPLGRQPLGPWLTDWQAPFTAGLFLDPGWRAVDPSDTALHGLRRRIKGVRYGLETLEPWCQPELLTWIESLRQAQEQLGELHDLQLLESWLGATVPGWGRGSLPQLRRRLRAAQGEHWRQWQVLAGALLSDPARHRLQRQLAALSRRGGAGGSGALPPSL